MSGLAIALSLTLHQSPLTFDLSTDKSRQVVVDREPGQYLGHVTTVLLEDGKTILCTYPKGHGKGAIVMKRSHDGGLTWTDRLDLPTSYETSLEVPTIYRTIEPVTGKKRLILWSGLYPARTSVSEDDGATWSELKTVGDWGGIVVMASQIQLKDGKYEAFFHDDGRFWKNAGAATGTFTLYECESSDGGVSWSYPHAIWSGSDVQLCEPGAVRSPDGRTLALLLRENKRVKQSHVMFSTDEAKTWTTPRELPVSLTGDRHTAAYLPDGRLVVCFRDMAATSSTKGDFVAWIGTFRDILEGTPGQYRVRLLDNTGGSDCGYPGVEVLPDGTVVATTYGHWIDGQPPYIVSVRFKVDEIDQLAKSKRSNNFFGDRID